MNNWDFTLQLGAREHLATEVTKICFGDLEVRAVYKVCPSDCRDVTVVGIYEADTGKDLTGKLDELRDVDRMTLQIDADRDNAERLMEQAAHNRIPIADRDYL